MLSRHHSTNVVCLRLEINQIHQTKDASVCYLFSRSWFATWAALAGEGQLPQACALGAPSCPHPHVWEIDRCQNEWPWPLFRGRIKVTSTIALHLTLNISETVRDRGSGQSRGEREGTVFRSPTSYFNLYSSPTWIWRLCINCMLKSHRVNKLLVDFHNWNGS